VTGLIRAKKSLGQHFLTDHHVARRIVDSVSPSRDEVVIEIGPGKGALTSLLAERSGWVFAVEIDPALVEELRRAVQAENLTIVEADALEVNWEELIEEGKSKLSRREQPHVRVVANLPYYISTPLIERLLSVGRRLFDMTLMLQKEVADRITSEPGGKEYGYLSVMVQYYSEAEKLFEVPASAFAPPPRVRSAVIRLRVRERAAVEVGDEVKFFKLVRAAFAQRRKTILNNLKAAAKTLDVHTDVESALEAASIEPRRRAETLSLAEFAALYIELTSNGSGQA
jgi:16S rRNA (adenine1518-N6/adenine1519-N6)-dimethyltransferase